MRPFTWFCRVISPWLWSAAIALGTGASAAVADAKIGRTLKESTPVWPAAPRPPAGAPNILIVLLDDVGFAATEPFGGPVRAPNLTRLAASGLRYNNFHTAATCSPTRASLLTGRNPHRAGFGTIAEFAQGFPGYDTRLKKETVLFAEILRRGGYGTAAIGKWHNTPYWETTPVGPFDRWPTQVGFDHFYGFIGGSDSMWAPALFRGTAPVDHAVTKRPSYHFSTDIADEAIRWVGAQESFAPGRPWLLYFAPAAGHEPHHVAPEWIGKYHGQFDAGWDVLREKIFLRQKSIGLFPSSTRAVARPAEIPAWDTFSAAQRRFLARQMEVFAGFMEHTDHELGRLLDTVRRGPRGDNTLVIFIGTDNGASGEGGATGWELRNELRTFEQRLARFDALGGPELMNNYAGGWAWATSSPFKWSKYVASDLGALKAPLLISWPARIKDRGGLRPQFGHVNDVAATVLEVAGIAPPATVDGVAQLPLDGTSLVATFDRADAPATHRLQIFEQSGNRAIYHDGWMAGIRHSLPWLPNYSDDFDHGAWELHHLDTDYNQADDLAAARPEKLSELRALFETQARANGVYPLMNPAFTAGAQRAQLPGAGARSFVFRPGQPRALSITQPDFQRSHRITADLENPATGADGVIITNGRRFNGFVLYAKAGRLIYENSFRGSGPEKIVAAETLPPGPVRVAFEFTGEHEQALGEGRRMLSGTGRLFIGDREVGRAVLASVSPHLFGTLSVGESLGEPVSAEFGAPFHFSGRIETVTVELR